MFIKIPLDKIPLSRQLLKRSSSSGGGGSKGGISSEISIWDVKNNKDNHDSDNISDQVDPFNEREEGNSIFVFETKQKKKKKSVSFHPDVIMIEMLHHKNFTDEERRQYWHNKVDLLLIKQDIIPIVYWMRSGIKLSKQDIHDDDDKYDECRDDNDDDYCTRGLEHRVYDRAMERKGHRIQGRDAVLEEQERQLALGMRFRNDNAIAFRYASVSNYCAFKAHEVGILDEIDSYNYNDDDENYNNNSSITTTKNRALIKSSSSISLSSFDINDNNNNSSSYWTSIQRRCNDVMNITINTANSSVQGATAAASPSSLNMSTMSVLFHNYLCS